MKLPMPEDDLVAEATPCCRVLLPASQQPCASDACRFRTWLQSHFDASGVVGKPLVLEEYSKPWDEVKRNEMFKLVQVRGCCLHHLVVFTVHVCRKLAVQTSSACPSIFIIAGP